MVHSYLIVQLEGKIVLHVYINFDRRILKLLENVPASGEGQKGPYL